MKTPDEIKKGLKKCPNADCSLCHSKFHCDIEAEALEYIMQLEARIDTLTAKAVLFDEAVVAGEKMKRERDAAVKYLAISRYCMTCIYIQDAVTGKHWAHVVMPEPPKD